MMACAAVAQTAPEKELCRISGVVHRADTGAPLEKATVTLYPRDVAATQVERRRIVRTGADGAFAFAGLSPGSYAIEASHNGFVFRYGAGSHIALHAGDVLSNIELTLEPAAIISGVVTDRDGEPVEGLPVMPLRIRYEPGGRRELSGGNAAITDDRGTFRLYDLSPGLYYLRTGGPIQRPMKTVPLKESAEGGLQYADTWYPENALAENAEPLRLHSGADIEDVRIVVSSEPALSIAGRVEGDLKSSPTKPSEVMCAKALPVTLMFGAGPAELGPDGSFKIEGLNPGDYVLSAQTVSNGRMVSLGYTKVRLVDRNVRANIELGSAAEVRGRLALKGSDAPLPSGLTMLLESQNSIAIYPALVDSNGRFDIAGVPPGEYTLSLNTHRALYIGEARCAGGDYTTQKMSLGVGALVGDCEVTLSDDAGVVHGQVMDGETPQPRMTVVLLPQSRELRRIARYTGIATSREQGGFEIRGVIPGDYFLFALSPEDANEAFSLNFPDRHAADAVSIQMKARETQSVNVSPLAASR